MTNIKDAFLRHLNIFHKFKAKVECLNVIMLENVHSGSLNETFLAKVLNLFFPCLRWFISKHL